SSGRPANGPGRGGWLLADRLRREEEEGLVAPEPDHGVAQSADLALPDAAVVAPLVLGDVLMLDPALTLPTLQHHPDVADPGQLAVEILIEGGFALTDDEEQPDPGKRPGWQAVEQAESVAPADAMSFGRVVERRSVTEARRLALTLTPGARHSHAGSLAGRSQCRGRVVASGTALAW